MATIRPFKALRPRPDLAQAVSSVPYDVVNREEAKALAKGNPHSFLHIIRSDIAFPAEQDPYAPEVYQSAKDKLSEFTRNEVLVEDQQAGLYLYQQQAGDHVQTGIVCCSAVDDYDSGVIKLHEKTRPEKEDDRTKHLLALGAHPGPVFLTYRSQEEIDQLVEKEIVNSPLYEVTAEDGVKHRVWKVSESEEFCSLFDTVPNTYVADGHHRAASASRARASLRDDNPAHSSEESYNYFLSVLYPDNQVAILPYNRIVKRCPLSVPDLLKQLAEVCQVREDGKSVPTEIGEVCMYADGSWRTLVLQDLSKGDPVKSLDISKLQSLVLKPIFDIEDQRTSDNIDFIGGSRGTNELERLVDSGKAACAFSLNPVSMDQLLNIADGGQIMPPKCTWFEPKLRSGLLIHKFES